MSFKNMDKTDLSSRIFPSSLLSKLRRNPQGCIHRTDLTSGKEVFFFPLWAHKKLLPPTLSVRRHFDVPYCAFMLLYLAS